MKIMHHRFHLKPYFSYQCLPYEDYAQTAEEHTISFFFVTVCIWTHNYPKD